METKIITHKKLAEIFDVSPSAVTLWLSEKNRRRPRPATAERIEVATGIKKELWYFGSRIELVEAIEAALGMRLNFGRGAVSKNSQNEIIKEEICCFSYKANGIGFRR